MPNNVIESFIKPLFSKSGHQNMPCDRSFLLLLWLVNFVDHFFLTFLHLIEYMCYYFTEFHTNFYYL